MSTPEQDRSYGDHGADTRQTDPNGISGAERTAVYHLYDAEGALLYIGATGNPDARFGQHSVSKSWWPQVARRDIAWFDSRPEALVAEGKAIYSEAPRHNLTNRPSQAKGRKVSLWLPDDVAARWKASGLPLSAVIKRGLARLAAERASGRGTAEGDK